MIMDFPSCLCNLFFLSSLCCVTTVVLATPLSPSLSRVPPCHAPERSALLQFKDSFHIDCSASKMSSSYPYPYPKMRSWTGDEANGDCCSWDGVECNEKTGHVIGLDLTSSCISGTFPRNSSLFFNLSHLKNLSLANNDFNCSQIPPEVGQFSKLQILDLSFSAFIGQIPSEISKLSELSYLDLSLNDGTTANTVQLSLKLEDPDLERLVRNLTRLEVLNLHTVDIVSPLPKFLSNLTSLQVISLSACNLYGEVPKGIFHLPHLEQLQLNWNQNLKGSLPEFHHNSPLRQLGLTYTSISGEIPPSIGNLANLEFLNLMSSMFSGPIPSSLGNLTKLTYLQLGRNTGHSGDIPLSLANLTQLQVLGLTGLNGTPQKLLPWLLKLNKLSTLQLNSMNLAGEIPSCLANFTSLTLLSLEGNQLTGQIPVWLMNLTQLQSLELSDNDLTGHIPKEISQLANLGKLWLSGNNLHLNFEALSKLRHLTSLQLSGVKLTFNSGKNAGNESLFKINELDLRSCHLTEFPYFLKSQDELEDLYLSNNSIHGLIPQWFVNATRDSLHVLYLTGNFITGFEQPSEVLPWGHLEILDLSENQIQGWLPIPPNSMVIYQVSHNRFDGVIPQQICLASSLSYLDVSFNHLDGSIPECLGELAVSLSILNLQGNNLHGTIPSAYPKSCQLKMINLSDNQLEGNMPRSLANCTMLEVLDIGKNHVNDTFPSWLGVLPELQILVLHQNNFHGQIGRPTTNVEFQSLRIIDLSHNCHTGGLPSEYLRIWDAMKLTEQNQSTASSAVVNFFIKGLHIAQIFESINYNYSITITNKGNEMLYTKVLTVLRVIDFSSNNFTGKIPNSIGELRGLEAFNLSNNNLDGNIPSSLTNMRNLESLDLSNNLLAGEIPQVLAQLTSLEVFNVSHNLLKGAIPQGGQFSVFDNSSFEGNMGMCGIPLSNMCGSADKPQQPPDIASNTEQESSNLIDWIVRTLGCVGGFAVGCAIGKYITDQNHEWFMETFGGRKRRRPKTRVRTARNRRS